MTCASNSNSNSNSTKNNILLPVFVDIFNALTEWISRTCVGAQS